ncbi:MAG: FtsX-like permease family protein, partial [Longimicrobiales bacterium]
FPNGDAIGKQVVYGEKNFEIVGIVSDIRGHTLRDEPSRRIYFPLARSHEGAALSLSFELRSSGDPATLVAPARRAIEQVNASVRVLSASPLANLVRQSMTQDRLVARVISFFGVLAMALAALGLYGVMTYGAVRRTSEFGLRVALGASKRGVRRMVLREALALVALGALAGLPLTLAATRLLRNQLFQVAPIDPLSFAIALAMLTASAALAAYIPARRATRIGPMVALRAE